MLDRCGHFAKKKPISKNRLHLLNEVLLECTQSEDTKCDHHAVQAKAHQIRIIMTKKVTTHIQNRNTNCCHPIIAWTCDMHGRTRRKMYRNVLRSCWRNRFGIKAGGSAVHGWSSKFHLKVSAAQENWHQLVRRLLLGGQHAGTISRHSGRKLVTEVWHD